MAFGHFLIGLSQCLGHGSWLVCEGPLLPRFLNPKACIKIRGCYLVLCHVLQLLPLRFTQKYLCCISKYAMTHLQKRNGFKFGTSFI